MVHNAAFEQPKRKALEETEKGNFYYKRNGNHKFDSTSSTLYGKGGKGHFVVLSSAAGNCLTPGRLCTLHLSMLLMVISVLCILRMTSNKNLDIQQIDLFTMLIKFWYNYCMI